MLASLLKMMRTHIRNVVGKLWGKIVALENPHRDLVAYVVESSDFPHHLGWARLLQTAYVWGVTKGYDEARKDLSPTERAYGKREHLRTISTPLDMEGLDASLNAAKAVILSLDFSGGEGTRKERMVRLRDRMLDATKGVITYMDREIRRLYGEGYVHTLERLGGSEMKPRVVNVTPPKSWETIPTVHREADEETPPTQTIENVFCPTGQGGGVDPSCSPGAHSGHGYTEKEIGEMSPSLRKILAARMGVKTKGKSDDEIKSLLTPQTKSGTVAPHKEGLSELLKAKKLGEEKGGNDPRGDLQHLPPEEKVKEVKSLIVAKVERGLERSGVGVSADKLYAAVNEKTPLDPEQFRALLIDAHIKGEVHLGGWSRMIDDIPNPLLAPLVSDKVMWYVNPKRGTVDNFDPSQPRDDQGQWSKTGTSSKPGGRVQRTNSLSHAAQVVFGSHLAGRTPGTTRELTDDDIRAIGFSPEGTTVIADGRMGEISTYTQSDEKDEQGSPQLMASRTIRKPWFGPLTCYNNTVKVWGSFKGKGLELFDKQVQTLQALGVKRIVSHAAGDAESAKTDPKSGLGYYAWPRMGFSGIMKSSQIAKLPPEIQKALKGKRDVRDLFDLPGGPEAWKAHGGSIKVHFDLSPNSRNMRALEAYKEERAKRPTVNEETPDEGAGNGPDYSSG